MNFEILEHYSPDWTDELFIDIGFPSEIIKSDQEVINKILEIQTVQRFAGVYAGTALSGIATKEEIEEYFYKGLGKMEESNYSHSFSNGSEGADLDATFYFFNGFFCLTYFSSDLKMEPTFHCEWFLLKEKGKWVEYKFNKGFELINFLSFLAGLDSIDELFLSSSEFSLEKNDEVEDLYFDQDEYELETEEEDAWAIFPAESIGDMFDELINFRNWMLHFFKNEVPPFLNIDNKLCYLLGEQRQRWQINTMIPPVIKYGKSEVAFFGFPQNFHNDWCNINIFVAKNEAGEKVVGIIERKNIPE
jgi:hypothetical protein